MPVKAKPVDPNKAALGARGRYSSEDRGAGAEERRSFYYEEARRKEALALHDDDSSSTESDDSRAASPSTSRQRPAAGATAPRGDDSDSDDERLLAEARMRTEKFLYPEGRAPPPPPQPTVANAAVGNERLIAYLRGRTDPAAPKEAEVAAGEGVAASGAAPPVAPTPGPAEPHKGRPTTTTAASSSSPSSSSSHSGDDSGTRGGAGAAPPADVDSPPAPAASGAPKRGGRERTEAERQFDALMDLLADDIHAERARRQQGKEETEEEERQRPATSPAAAAAAAPSTALSDRSPATYRLPARNFAAMQQDALQQLYEEWGGGGAFVATDYTAAAFALAANSAFAQRAAPGQSRAVPDAPFSIEELAAAGSAARQWASPAAVAREASGRLERYFQCVRCVERLVRDPRFVGSVATFLYERHRVFLPHLATDADGAAAAEHSHEEFAAYQAFGERVSAVFLDALARSVRGFDEREFVEQLYDVPEGTAESGAADLSFPAWRILLAMSDFDCFFQWVMDYVQEEYQIGGDGTGQQHFAVAGARGLRALLRSTYTGSSNIATASTAGTADDTEAADAALLSSRPASQGLPPRHLPALPTPVASASSDRRDPLEDTSAEASSPLMETAGGARRGLASSLPPSSHGARHEKLFPTPPASADGLRKKRLSTVPGRTLPPLSGAPASPRKRSVSKKRSSSTASASGRKSNGSTAPAKPKLSKPVGKTGTRKNSKT